MSRILGKINLLQLKAVVKKMKGQSGDIECLVLPIEENNFFKGEKGIYLDLIAFEYESKNDSKDTHLVKQSLDKTTRELMSDEEIKAMPILGNLRLWDDNYQGEAVSSSEVTEELDDLPF